MPNTVNKRFNEAKTFLGYWVPWFVGGAMVITANLASVAFQNLFEHFVGVSTKPLTDTYIFWYFVYIGVFFVTLWLFYMTSKSLFRPRTREMREEISPQRRENLFIILSNINPFLCKQCGDDLIPDVYQLRKSGIKSLEKDLEEMKGKKISWPWQMALIAIQHHIGSIEKPTLKNVVIICSPESRMQFNKFNDILTSYLKGSNIQIKLLGIQEHQTVLINTSHPKNLESVVGINFEAFDELTDLITDGIVLLKKDGEKEKNIIIDITGGLKVASIVAATLTFNRPIKAQYISFQNEKYTVKGYDVVYGVGKVK